MRGSWSVGLALLCAGCASGGANVQTAAAAPDCRQFNTPVTIEGQSQQLSGLACRQPDGTWKPVDAVPPLYASPAYAMATAAPEPAVAPNCAYPMAAEYTEQCNWYINRHKFGHH